MRAFESILRHYGWVTPQKQPTNADSASIVQLFCRFALPADFSDFLKSDTGFEGNIGNEYVVLYDNTSIIEYNKTLDSQDLPDTLIIGSNGGAEFIALVATGDGVCHMVLSPWIDLSADYHIIIGSSFSDFLHRLDAGNEWFAD